MAEPKGSVQAEDTDVELPLAAIAEATEVAFPTLANESEETEVEEAGDQEERAAVGGKEVDNDDVSDDSQSVMMMKKLSLRD